MGVNRLIGATSTPLSDFFREYFWNIYISLFKYFLQYCTILLRFVLKTFHKYVIFNVFQVHLQVLLLFKSNG
jgi:hypothetical protein